MVNRGRQLGGVQARLTTTSLQGKSLLGALRAPMRRASLPILPDILHMSNRRNLTGTSGSLTGFLLNQADAGGATPASSLRAREGPHEQAEERTSRLQPTRR